MNLQPIFPGSAGFLKHQRENTYMVTYQLKKAAMLSTLKVVITQELTIFLLPGYVRKEFCSKSVS